jgi:hypothetical protein
VAAVAVAAMPAAVVVARVAAAAAAAAAAAMRWQVVDRVGRIPRWPSSTANARSRSGPTIPGWTAAPMTAPARGERAVREGRQRVEVDILMVASGEKNN